jgi:hypothetical protein
VVSPLITVNTALKGFHVTNQHAWQRCKFSAYGDSLKEAVLNWIDTNQLFMLKPQDIEETVSLHEFGCMCSNHQARPVIIPSVGPDEGYMVGCPYENNEFYYGKTLGEAISVWAKANGFHGYIPGVLTDKPIGRP